MTSEQLLHAASDGGFEAIHVDPLTPAECAVIQAAIENLGDIGVALVGKAYGHGVDQATRIYELAGRVLRRYEVLAAIETPGGAR